MVQRFIEIDIDDIIEYEMDGALLTGIVVSMEDEDDTIVRVFEWPYGAEMPEGDINLRCVDVPLDTITAVKVKMSSYVIDETEIN